MYVKQILACSATHYLLTKMRSCFLSLGRCRFCQQSLVVKMGDAPAGLQPIAEHKPLPLHTYADGQSWRKSRSKSQAERENHTEVSITTEGSHGACFCRPPVQCLVKHASEGHLALILNSIMSDHSVLYSVYVSHVCGELEVKSCSWFHLEDVHHLRLLRGVRYAGRRFTMPPSPSQMCRAHQYKWHLGKIFDYSVAGAQTW